MLIIRIVAEITWKDCFNNIFGFTLIKSVVNQKFCSNTQKVFKLQNVRILTQFWAKQNPSFNQTIRKCVSSSLCAFWLLWLQSRPKLQLKVRSCRTIKFDQFQDFLSFNQTKTERSEKECECCVFQKLATLHAQLKDLAQEHARVVEFF